MGLNIWRLTEQPLAFSKQKVLMCRMSAMLCLHIDNWSEKNTWKNPIGLLQVRLLQQPIKVPVTKTDSECKAEACANVQTVIIEYSEWILTSWSQGMEYTQLFSEKQNVTK